VNESADRPRRSLDIDIEYLLSHFHPRGHTMRLRPDATRWTGSSSTAALRVSDVERNAVADKLSRHFSDGRLDQVEFKERLDDVEPPPKPPRRRRLVPFLLMLAFIAVVAGSSISLWHAFQVPWLLVAVVGFFLWHRAGRQWRDRH
jgi:hypothetical protein